MRSLDEEPEGDELPAAEATRYRAIGARCNYLQRDSADIQYSVKEVCRLMSRPTTQSWEMLKRVGQYLKKGGRGSCGRSTGKHRRRLPTSHLTPFGLAARDRGSQPREVRS